jgi:hypothetical protein
LSGFSNLSLASDLGAIHPPWNLRSPARRLAPSRWLAMTVDDADMIRTSKSLN